MRFFGCPMCKKVITMLTERDVPTICCGKPMEELIPGTSDGAAEKHVPVVTEEHDTVTVEVGTVTHPMLEEHYIEWIVIETKEGHQMKHFRPGEAPKAVFTLSDTDELVAAYEYCNLHGLWKK